MLCSDFVTNRVNSVCHNKILLILADQWDFIELERKVDAGVATASCE